MNQVYRSIAGVALALLAGVGMCKWDKLSAVELRQNPLGNFHLLVSNGSYTDDKVDIKVLIDGQVAVYRTFRSNPLRMWDGKGYIYKLDPGEHELQAYCNMGPTEFSTTFTVEGDTYGLLSYVYFPDSDDPEASQRHFSFSVLDHQPMFL